MVKININVNTEKTELDGAELFIQVSNEKDVEGTVETPVDTDVAVVGETESNEWFQKLLERLSLGTLNWLVCTW